LFRDVFRRKAACQSAAKADHVQDLTVRKGFVVGPLDHGGGVADVFFVGGD
jgi:hypothetical protein